MVLLLWDDYLVNNYIKWLIITEIIFVLTKKKFPEQYLFSMYLL